VPSAPRGPRSRSCCAPTAIMPVRKCSTGAVPIGWIGSLAWLPMQRSPCRGAGEGHRRTLHGGAQPRQGAALHAVLRCRAELAPGRAHHRPGRGWAFRNRYSLHRDQSFGWPRQALVRRALLRARSSREPHQGLEEPPRRRPHLLPPSRGQPVSPVPACRRLLACAASCPNARSGTSCSSTPCDCA
jgi:hypothetical protein